MKKNIIFLIIVFLFTGCTQQVFDTKELLRAPKISNKYIKIQDSLNKLYEDYSLITPNTGKNKDAIYMINLREDKDDESVVFLKDLKSKSIKIVILKKEKENWIETEIFTTSRQGINKIEFSDLDGDGYFEIIVGWEGVSVSNKGISVFSLKESKIREVFSENFTLFDIEDLDNNGDSEILIIKFNKLQGEAKAILYDLDLATKQVYYVDEVEMDGYVSNYYSVKSGNVKEKQKGFLVDINLGAHSSYTDLIVYNNKKLENVFFDKQWKYTDITHRPYSSVSSDFDNDGIIEIPLLRVPEDFEESSVTETLYITVWMEWDGKDGLSFDFESFENVLYNYSIKFPRSWENKVSLEKQNNKVIYKYYSLNKKEPINIFEILVENKEKYYNNKSDYSGFKLINVNIDKVYLFKSINNLNYSDVIIDMEYIRNNFNLIRR